ncbi:MAG: hypothetical protein JXB30_03255 [Anaerolineae bacterium]|nr:hypothetical protein [Anaerolineae bacterium]
MSAPTRSMRVTYANSSTVTRVFPAEAPGRGGPPVLALGTTTGLTPFPARWSDGLLLPFNASR